MRNTLVWLAWLTCLPVGCSRSTPIAEVSAGTAVGEMHLPEPGTADWPWWRGPALNGKAADQDAPVAWGPDENIVWKAEVPGRGHATPTVWGHRVFVATADEKEEAQLVVAYDRSTGKPLWKTVLHRGGFMPKHDKNSHASATPACDGERVYTPFMVQDALWVTATDLDGRIVWKTKAGPFVSQHGYGSSPVLYGSLVIVNGDNPGSGFLAALDRQTGRIVWRTARPNEGSYGTPIVARSAGRPQLLLSGGNTVSSYEPATGRRTWYCQGPSQVTAATIAFDDERVYASGGYPQKELLAIRADGSGDVSRTHVVWRTGQGVSYVPSPLLADGLLYVVADNGIVTCFDARAGRQVWKERLGGNFSASPVLAGGNIYVPNEEGTTFVFKAGTRFELVARNDLGDGGFASPVICGGRLFLRTNRQLFCIGKPALAVGGRAPLRVAVNELPPVTRRLTAH